jgi:hypothetical protein
MEDDIKNLQRERELLLKELEEMENVFHKEVRLKKSKLAYEEIIYF